MRGALLLAAALALVLTGCDAEEAFKSESDFGKSLVADLRSRNLDAIERQFDRTAWSEGSRAGLAQMARLLPAKDPTSVRVAGVNVNAVKSAEKEAARNVSLLLQYQFDDKWFLFAASWRRPEAGPALVQSMRIQPLPVSLEEIHRFSFDGRGALHYTVLALAVLLPIFTLAMLVLCLRTPMPRWRKSLWVLAILVGVTAVRFNWTSGAALWHPATVLLGSAAYNKADLGPAILSIGFPLGALAFLVRRRSLLRAAGEDDAGWDRHQGRR